MKKIWTKEEENKFIEMYPTIPTGELVVVFDRSEKSLVTKAYRLSIKKVIRADGLCYIYDDEEKQIIEYSKTHSIPEIKKFFGRDYTTISRLLLKNNCEPLPSNIWWSEEQIKFLLEKFYIESPENISKYLNKKWRTITKKAREMGLMRKSKKGYNRKIPSPLSDEEKDFILLNYDKIPSGVISKEINRSVDIIIRFCSQNKLNLLRSRKSPKSYSNEVLLDELKNKAIELGRCPTTQEIQRDFSFPSIDIYYDRFGSFSNACELIGLENNVGYYGTLCYSKNNDKCYSVAEQIITNYLILNNIRYQKEYAYSNLIQYIDCGIIMDWCIDDNIVVEYFGLQKFEDYKIKTEMKQKICEINNIKIISIFPKDMDNLDKIFHEYK